MKKLLPILLISVAFIACYREEITIGPDANDTFYIKHEDASMHVQVKGNTASKVFLVIVHGGPGSSGYVYHTPKMEEIIQKDIAVVFYDQRNAGASQGNANTDNYNLAIYADDLHELLTVLQYRYGADIKFFLLSKSFGGMVASAFMTNPDYQIMVNGWIFADASHNYGLNDSLTYQMLLDAGTQHIAQGLNADGWRPIVDYCQQNPPGPFSFEQSFHLNLLGWDAQEMIEGLEPYCFDVIRRNYIKEHIPLTNYWLGRTNAGKRKFNKTLTDIKFSDELFKVKTPVLVCFGKLDFVCPAGLGDDFLAHIGSTDKQMILFERSAHRFEEQEAFHKAFHKFMVEHL